MEYKDRNNIGVKRVKKKKGRSIYCPGCGTFYQGIRKDGGLASSRYATRKFCNPQCYKTYQKRKSQRTTKNARMKRRIKDKVLQRDDGCIFCNSGLFDNLITFPRNPLEVHRIKPGQDGGEYILKNCVTVCKQHHRILSDTSNSYIKKWVENTPDVSDCPIDLDIAEIIEMETYIILNPKWISLKQSMNEYIEEYMKSLYQQSL